jgi:hypothetical protein
MQNPARLTRFGWVGTARINTFTRNYFLPCTLFHASCFNATICVSRMPCKNK